MCACTISREITNPLRCGDLLQKRTSPHNTLRRYLDRDCLPGLNCVPLNDPEDDMLTWQSTLISFSHPRWVSDVLTVEEGQCGMRQKASPGRRIRPLLSFCAGIF